jgi:predicted nucleotide-binding protein (sugar kinase/HSP70/actin superfamily)
MSSGGAEAFAAACRNLGIDGRVVPEGNERTYELAGRYTSGDECLPARVTVGGFLQIMESPGFDPSKTAFFMPTAGGPCRFGQYAPFMRQILDEMGYGDLPVISPTSADGYSQLGASARSLQKLGWMALVGSDAIRKMLHLYRPRETRQGAADLAYKKSLGIFCEMLEHGGGSGFRMAGKLAGAMEEARDIFRAIPADFSGESMLIGVVGEIFCRLNVFSNEDLIRKLEPFGATAWLSDISEWVWYTDEEQVRNLKRKGKTFSKAMIGVALKKFVQQKYETTILAPLHRELSSMPEPHNIRVILDKGEPYLPWQGALGEMALSVGKAVYLYENGADGIIDISPFTCMNGIVSESIYPRLSRDHDGIPIRSFYFDGTNVDLENELAVFMELVTSYHRKKTKRRAGEKAA